MGSGGGVLRKELLAGIRLGAKPAVLAIKAGADGTLPTRGGLSARFKRGVGVRTRTSGQNVGVRIVGKNGYDVEAIDAGNLRHPVFGNKSVYVTQSVTPGWFTKPIEDSQDAVQAALLDVIDTIVKKVEG